MHMHLCGKVCNLQALVSAVEEPHQHIDRMHGSGRQCKYGQDSRDRTGEVLPTEVVVSSGGKLNTNLWKGYTKRVKWCRRCSATIRSSPVYLAFMPVQAPSQACIGTQPSAMPSRPIMHARYGDRAIEQAPQPSVRQASGDCADGSISAGGHKVNAAYSTRRAGLRSPTHW